MFSVNYEINPKLPKLAWLAEINKKTKNIVVHVGKHVECTDNYFVSGVWDGDFSEGGFDESSVFYGTGAKIENECIKFYTPSHALERIIYSEDENCVIFSNSVPFLMEYCSLELDPFIDQYEKIFCSILHGPKKMQREIPLLNSRSMNHFIVGCASLYLDGRIEYTQRTPVEEYKNYDDYFGRMMKAMHEVYENATSEKRKHTKYGLCSTISSGYDSVANAAVAKRMGCDTVVTLSGGIYDEDDGTLVAREMGYSKIIKKDYLSYIEKKGLIDAEYISSGEIAKHQQFSVFEDSFKDCIVFMGTRGDYFWGLNTVANNDFEMIGFFYNETDISYTENALKNGYIILPVATYGTSASTSIQKISKSEEMLSWRIHNEYDRPIPRRIAEETGALRESFGQIKRGGGFSFCYDTKKTLADKMSAEGYESFVKYCSQNKSPKTVSKYIHAIQYWISFLPSYINYALRKLHINIRLKQNAIKVSNPFVASDLIFWSVDIMKKKYSEAMEDSMEQ